MKNTLGFHVESNHFKRLLNVIRLEKEKNNSKTITIILKSTSNAIANDSTTLVSVSSILNVSNALFSRSRLVNISDAVLSRSRRQVHYRSEIYMLKLGNKSTVHSFDPGLFLSLY